MQWPGSKKRIANQLLPIILEKRLNASYYFEPFVGGCNLIDKVTGIQRIGNDFNSYLIAMWQALQSGWIPPDYITENDYYKIKTFPNDYTKELVCFVASLCSFGAKWWGGYARGGNKNYALIGRKSLLKQIKYLMDVDFCNKDYKDLCIPKKSIVYCDPPYKNTTKYGNKEFDHDNFWEWARKLSNRCYVYISEYTAPIDFKVKLCTQLANKLGKNDYTDRFESLFVYNSGLSDAN